MNKKLVEVILKHSYFKEEEFVSENTKLEEDLYIYGDDAEFFFGEYMEKFEVDLSNFDMEKYFTPELVFPFDLYFFSYTLHRRFSKRYKQKDDLTVGDLERGIHYGRLDEEIISMRKSDNE